MKKILTFLFLLVGIAAYASKPTYSKWSATVEAGVNRFDGDINQSLVNTFPTSNWNPTLGANVEYKITPVYGLSLNGYYVPINANTNYNGVMTHVGTKISTLSLNGTVDFTHLMFPYTRTKWSINGSIGLGYAYYKYDFYALCNSYGNAITMPTSVSLKYNVSNHIDVGTKVSYICFNKDNLEGLHGWKGVTNDRVGLGTVFVTYKFNPKRYAVKDNSLNMEIMRLKSKVLHLDDKIQRQSDRIDTLSSYMLNRIQNTYINDTVIVIEDIPSIYFDFNKSNLDDWAVITISKVASKLIKNPELKVSILGYCDWIGDVPYNFNLSDKRVNITRKELVEIWNIDPNRITIDGKGKLNDPKMKYRPNRRCDFIFSK